MQTHPPARARLALCNFEACPGKVGKVARDHWEDARREKRQDARSKRRQQTKGGERHDHFPPERFLGKGKMLTLQQRSDALCKLVLRTNDGAARTDQGRWLAGPCCLRTKQQRGIPVIYLIDRLMREKTIPQAILWIPKAS